MLQVNVGRTEVPILWYTQITFTIGGFWENVQSSICISFEVGVILNR